MGLTLMKQSFKKDKRGNFSVMFALVAIPLLGSAAMMVDYTNMSKRHSDLQNSVDSAVLMAASIYRDTGELPSNGDVRKLLRTNFGEAVTLTNLSVREDGTEVYLQARIETPGLLLPKLREGTFLQLADATVPIGRDGAPYEIVLVLDMTYSMSADNKMQDLKTEAVEFVNYMFDQVPAGATDALSIGIVPFSQYVMISKSFRGAPWLRIHGDVSTNCNDVAPIIDPSLCTNVMQIQDGVEIPVAQCPPEAYGPPVQQCYTTEWQGCVASRMPPFNTRDEGYNANPIWGVTSPPLNCYREILPLTTERATVVTNIWELPLWGDTYAAPGVIWGLRVLSPEAPYTEGKPYEDPSEKVMIVMTDGDNTESPADSGVPGIQYHTGSDVALG